MAPNDEDFSYDQIINNPFEEPTRHYAWDGETMVLQEGRRPANYARSEGENEAQIVPELKHLEENVNTFRQEVRDWRNAGYGGVTDETRTLLYYWRRKDLRKRLFFCQIELIETIVWLHEVANEELKQKVPLDLPLTDGFKPLRRYAGKMATGTGKTWVMACLIIWQVINHLAHPDDERFTPNILVITPNITVKNRDIGGLDPETDPTMNDNYYINADLVPVEHQKKMIQANIFITNWHYFLVTDTGRRIEKKGKPGEEYFINKVKRGFKRFDPEKKIFILNDEGHHAYRLTQEAMDSRPSHQTSQFQQKIEQIREVVSAHEMLKDSKKDQKLDRVPKKIEEQVRNLSEREIADRKFLLQAYAEWRKYEEMLQLAGDTQKLRQLMSSKDKEQKELVAEVAALSEIELKKLREKKNLLQDMIEAKLDITNDAREATVWIEGIDRLNTTLGLVLTVDLSATPFYNATSGYSQGKPFPWIVTDFNLFDAMESGLTKIPYRPIAEDAGEKGPQYDKLFGGIRGDGDTSRKKNVSGVYSHLKPDEVYALAEDALKIMANSWRKSREMFTIQDYGIPPMLIVACADTKIADVFFKKIQNGQVIPEFKNDPDHGIMRTLEIDQVALDKTESQISASGEYKSGPATFREKIANLGKEGTPEQDICCVVAVNMLSEGWDAHNVTQILGVRAFTSPLLCEQVIGRGLRRMNYDDFTAKEFVDIFGIPFDLFPSPVAKISGESRPTSVPTTLVKADPARSQFEIMFPQIEGYVLSVDEDFTLDFSNVAKIVIEVPKTPFNLEEITIAGKKLSETQMRLKVYQDRDFVELMIANDALHQLKGIEFNQDDERAINIRLKYLPILLRIVHNFVQRCVEIRGSTKPGANELIRHKEKIISGIISNIQAKNTHIILPRVGRYYPSGSSGDVHFRTADTTNLLPTTKSHLDVEWCPNETARNVHGILETSDVVYSYASCLHLGFYVIGATGPPTTGSSTIEFYPDYLFTIMLHDADVEERKNNKGNPNSGPFSKDLMKRRLVHVIEYLVPPEKVTDFEEIEKEKCVRRWVEAVNNEVEKYGFWTYIRKVGTQDLKELIDQKRIEIKRLQGVND